jgi:redox-sensitive bicupin YhaK (pirin superfamily)
MTAGTPPPAAPARIVDLPLHERGTTFRARRIDAGVLGAPTDPWLAVDRFHLAAPTFPPHPHAGFSALTYVLPESPGTMRNRDSLGAHLMIPPGALHWTAAGSGILHEEIPADPAAPVEGLQIFLNHPAARQEEPPRIAHLDAGEVPEVDLGAGSRARVLIGAFAGAAARLDSLSPVTLLDLTLAPGARFVWDARAQPASFALVEAGAADIMGAGLAAAGSAVVPAGDGTLGLAAGPEGARVVLFAGEPLRQPVHWLGSLCLASPEAAEAALLRFRSGAMGHLEPYRAEG